MLKRLLLSLLICVMIGGALHPASAVDRGMDMAHSSGDGGDHDMSAGVAGSMPCDTGAHILPDDRERPPCRHHDGDPRGCSTMSISCSPPALAGLLMNFAGNPVAAPWLPWVAPVRHLTAISAPPDLRPPKALS